VVEASRENETSVVVAHLTLVPDKPTTATALAQAGAQHLLAAVAELQLLKDGQSDQLSKRRQKAHRA
jgi:response regulator RpfG family c-di-GMP phosphodiesterase